MAAGSRACHLRLQLGRRPIAPAPRPRGSERRLKLPLTETPSSPRRERRDGDGATDALALPPLCLAPRGLRTGFSAMGTRPPPLSRSRAPIPLKTAASPACRASTLRCDHCRGELGHGPRRYWHMQFCSSACVTAYQQRLAPETKEKILGLDVSLSEDQISGSNLTQSRVFERAL
jgi:hypothetical protein